MDASGTRTYSRKDIGRDAIQNTKGKSLTRNEKTQDFSIDFFLYKKYNLHKLFTMYPKLFSSLVYTTLLYY